MELQNALKKVLGQLRDVTGQLKETEFIMPVKSLNGSTIGQHTRHTIEFFTCLKDGYKDGRVNYDKRSHDTEIESSKVLAMEMIARLEDFVMFLPADKPFVLEVNYDPDSGNNVLIHSSYYRELVYNIEHAIHHMALIKVGLKEICSAVKIPSDFGVAVSTVKYQKIQTLKA